MEMTGAPKNPPRPGPAKKPFKRTNVSIGERIASLLIVVLLAAIGVAVWIKGRSFDPGLYSLRTEALKSTEAPTAVAGRTSANAGTERKPVAQVEDETSQQSGVTLKATEAVPETPEGSHKASAAPVAKAPPIEIPGAQPMGDTEFYSPESLYEKIDGRAPAYIEFHFQQLRSRSFSAPGSPGSYVDVYEYRMNSPLNAFGIFALERDPSGKPLDFAPDGYSGEMGFYFRQGNCYVQVIASDQKPATMGLARSVSEHLAKTIPPDNTGLDSRRRLPEKGLIPESVNFTQENALGQAFLKDVFQADYQFEGQKISFFLMVSTPEAAAKAWNSFLAFSGRYGGKAEALPDIAGAKIFQAQNFGKWKLIYQRDGELGGVLDAQDPAAASAFLNKVLDGSLR